MLFRDEDLGPPKRRPRHSDDLDAESEAKSVRGTLYRLLDPAFGFGVWALHFLLVYCSTAIFCALGSERIGVSALQFKIALILVTIMAGAIVIGHGFMKYRLDEGILDHRFLVWITIGHDAIAAVGIVWMLFPILLVPACS